MMLPEELRAIAAQDARQCALHFIRPQVLRGCTADEITDGWWFRDCTLYTAQCGGWCMQDGKHYNRFTIIITKILEYTVFFRFDIHDLIKEIKAPVSQLTLW
jgi:hypothetical protein